MWVTRRQFLGFSQNMCKYVRVSFVVITVCVFIHINTEEIPRLFCRARYWKAKKFIA